MDSLKKAAIREVRLSWGGGGSPPQKNFFPLLFVDFLFTQVIMMMTMVMIMIMMMMMMMLSWAGGGSPG